ncbi:hypothetical protein CDD80_3834 [Ophiocordyceps camponoti-rufipedis]|uniref:Zn(2)-C6 fungal-type domain-containing protein n=1 Tax=Ophiocordyceps camponoti-rufipedis TaxID=2004952 RepID=A0A2C5Z182_9HYPO|nr:hypothetical protein CDD80_3834 [Ophiocordyceps camponoti-rufipedis]
MQPKLTLVTYSRVHSCWPGDKEPGAANNMVLEPPFRMETAWRGFLMRESVQRSQLLPTSTGLVLPIETASTPATTPSDPPSANPWSDGLVDDMDRGSRCVCVERCSDTSPVTPKLEPMDDDINLSLVKLAPSTPPTLRSPVPNEPLAKQRRPRGRPRKMCLASPTGGTSKATNGRSKTGCITCRKRKKKCDEAKPRCTLSP